MAETTLEQQLEELLDQETFSPPDEFAERAVVSDAGHLRRWQTQDYEGFWAEQAARAATGTAKWDQVLDGRLAVREVVRRREAEHRLQLPGPACGGGQRRPRRVSLARRGGRAARPHLRRPPSRGAEVRQRAEVPLGIGKGDVVGIYLPMIPEVVVAMLACARIGAIHNVVFAQLQPGLGARTDGVLAGEGAGHRGRRAAQGQDGADQGKQVDEVIGDLVSRLDRGGPQRGQRRADEGRPRPLVPGPLVDAADDECPPEPMDAEDPLYILYTPAAPPRSRRASCTPRAAT